MILICSLLIPATLLAMLWGAARIALAPKADEWSVRVGRGPLKMEASVPQLVWLATTPWIGQVLDGVRVPSRIGFITLGWKPAGVEGPEPVLTLHCEPCTFPVPAALGQERLRVPAAQIALSRGEGVDRLQGQLLLASESPQGERAIVSAKWQARRHGPGWDVTMRWPDAPARHWVALLAPGLAELRVAHIEGHVAATARVQLPSGRFELTPQVQGLAVSGLGTETWAHARSSCGPSHKLDARGWLARAVVAAEDQRFYEHPGYDLEELQASLAINERNATIRRGGSTLTQQVAKLMVAGGERTLTRKVRELLYAVEIEQSLGKARILQLYLNLAPWGQTVEGQLVCGADAAARHYFGVSAKQIDARQSVTLAAILRNPAHDASAGRLLWVAEQVRGVSRPQQRMLTQELRVLASAQLNVSVKDQVSVTRTVGTGH
ncbi:biosynthetic peptidoglycan transglycosylase [Ottowia thiooxydans]|uniref:biosynthetic peptidoglycan transglycosylase n=1 Tax=Ottowia thiooxydans TaxID=219182 RepID=UPI00068447B5|nr:biosynthetic peptidoglycan transglycosylase [Ottowia thiooxydans]